MQIIETTFERLPRERLVIGFEGENLRATVRIDCASVFAEYPNATPALIVKPLFADAYPVVVDRNGTCVDWLITSEILSFNGDGEIQLVFYKDEVICKSAVSKIRVCRSLQVTGTMPDPVAQWIENANRKLAEVDAQIVELEGMVDTATDAATRAEQSASTASTKAEQAAGSAATATEKATEATNAAGTATAKAAEAEQSALTASTKASDAAESQRITEEKAQSAITAESNAQDAKDIALRAKQDALDAQTSAEAARTAAETSATQAAQSAQGASADAQTATQKAAEAQQSATGATQSEQTATQKAGEAAASAQAASDAKTAVEQTAEQLADSLEQIEQNTQDIAELDERKANVDGYYPDMTVGNAEQLNSSKYVENSEPYTLRTSGGTSDIGNREYLDAVVGGTLAWNQMVRDEASENSTDFAPIVTVTDAVEDAAGVKVKIEPVQDLHGYDHPWPAGGGKNLFDVDGYTPYDGVYCNASSVIVAAGGNQGFVIPIKGDTTYTMSVAVKNVTDIQLATFPAYPTAGDVATARTSTTGSAASKVCTITSGADDNFLFVKYNQTGATQDYTKEQVLAGLQIEIGSTSTEWSPYANICPITGWDGVKVTRTGKNLLDDSDKTVRESSSGASIEYGKTNGILLKAGSTYTFSLTGVTSVPNGIYIRRLDNNNSLKSAYNANSVTVTVSNDIVAYGYVLYNNRQSADTWAGIKAQFEIGSTATDYESFAGNTYDITLPTEAGTVYGGELTVNADGSGSLVVDRASVDMGELSWMFMNVNGAQRLCSVSLNPLPLTPKSDYYFPEIICSAYKVERVSQLPNIPYSVSMGYSGYGYGNRLIVNDETITTVEQATEKLSGQTCVYKLLTSLTYTLTASEIRTLLGTNNVWSDAGQTALTYTGTDEHLTLESGKKYLSRISGTDSMLLGSGQEITAAKGADNVFDLTQMFGTAVADYVYGQGAGFFRKWFGGSHYPYNAGELLSVEGLQSHDMVGFNLWDEEWEVGDINPDNGSFVNATNRIRSKNLCNCVPGANYYIIDPTNGYNIRLFFYDANKNFISAPAWMRSRVYTFPDNAHYFAFIVGASYGTTYKHDICISLAHNGSRNGEYEPYEKHSYPLDSTVILRGIPKVGASGVYWDGDRYLPDGTVERRYYVYTITGDEVWNYNGWMAGAISMRAAVPVSASPQRAAVCDRWSNTKATYAGNTHIYFADAVNYFNSVEDFKAFIVGAKVIYELATPTTETAQPYHSTQWVSDWGTEEFVSTGIVPVGSETRYPANLRDKLQHLPDAASGNGSYLITQTDGQMVLTPFPAPPSTAGNYVLKATVVNGVATYTWEVAT